MGRWVDSAGQSTPEPLNIHYFRAENSARCSDYPYLCGDQGRLVSARCQYLFARILFAQLRYLFAGGCQENTGLKGQLGALGCRTAFDKVVALHGDRCLVCGCVLLHFHSQCTVCICDYITLFR